MTCEAHTHSGCAVRITCCDMRACLCACEQACVRACGSAASMRRAWHACYGRERAVSMCGGRCRYDASSDRLARTDKHGRRSRRLVCRRLVRRMRGFLHLRPRRPRGIWQVVAHGVARGKVPFCVTVRVTCQGVRLGLTEDKSGTSHPGRARHALMHTRAGLSLKPRLQIGPQPHTHTHSLYRM